MPFVLLQDELDKAVRALSMPFVLQDELDEAVRGPRTEPDPHSTTS